MPSSALTGTAHVAKLSENTVSIVCGFLATRPITTSMGEVGRAAGPQVLCGEANSACHALQACGGSRISSWPPQRVARAIHAAGEPAMPVQAVARSANMLHVFEWKGALASPPPCSHASPTVSSVAAALPAVRRFPRCRPPHRPPLACRCLCCRHSCHAAQPPALQWQHCRQAVPARRQGGTITKPPPLQPSWLRAQVQPPCCIAVGQAVARHSI